jgi:threonine dehydrogenase-like Zn-dependent dehydrogenase
MNERTAQASAALAEIKELHAQAEVARNVGTVAGIGAIVSGIVVGMASGPVGLGVAAVAAAFAAGQLVRAERKDERASDIMSTLSGGAQAGPVTSQGQITTIPPRENGLSDVDKTPNDHS